MARSGVDAGTAASFTGHSPVVMLRFYRQVTDEDRARAAVVSGLGDLPAGEMRGTGMTINQPKRAQGPGTTTLTMEYC